MYRSDTHGAVKPLCILSTATAPNHITETMSDLTCMNWTKKAHQLRSSMLEFRQRDISMKLDLSGGIAKCGFPLLFRVLKETPKAHICVFVNFVKECGKCTTLLEDELANKELDIDVININGGLEKEDKFGLVRLFTGSLISPGAHPQVLVATGAANTGIDQILTKLVLRVGLPRNLVTFLQERGRIRDEGTILVLTNWRLFIKLLLTVLLDHESKTVNSSSFENSMIRSTPSAQAVQHQFRSNSRSKLTNEEKKKNKDQAIKDLVEVLYYFFMPALGCLHQRAEFFLSRGQCTYDPLVCSIRQSWCGNKCYICNGDYTDSIRPIIYEKAKEFLQSSLFNDNYRTSELTFDNTDDMPNILWESNDWKRDIFGKASVTQYNVFAFFFQLIASGILSIDYKGKDGVRFLLTRVDSNTYLYEDVNAWKGFEFRRSGRGRDTSITFDDLVRRERA